MSNYFNWFGICNVPIINYKTMSTEQEKEITDEEITIGNEAAEEIKEETAEESNEEKLTKQVGELNNKYIRLYSEFENFRRRTAKEKLEIITNANKNLLGDLIPVADDFERAIAANKKSDNIKDIKEGMELLNNKFFNILKSKGLKEMNSQGKEFDVDEHEALTKIPAPSKKLRGKVVDVIEKGYYLNDKVLRFAKVVVGE
jgi:molecular chaperone GrpE